VDGRLAPALRIALHRFAKPWYRLRALRVFRDDASLSANPDLWSAIEDALGSAEFFILLASPEAAASHWVDQEVRYWLEYRPAANILIGLTGGTIKWDHTIGAVDRRRTNALPPSLQSQLHGEPRYIDLRWTTTSDDVSIAHPRFRDCVADFSAPMHHRAKDELLGDDVRQHKQVFRLISGVIATLLVLTATAAGLALVALHQRDAAQREAAIALSRQLAAEAGTGGNAQLDRSLLLGVESQRAADTTEARSAIVTGLETNPELMSLVHSSGVLRTVAFQDDRTLLVSSDYGALSSWDVVSNEPIRKLSVDTQQVATPFSPDGRMLLVGNALWSVRPWKHVMDFPPKDVDSPISFSSDGTLVAEDTGTDSGPLLVDSKTGRALGGFASAGVAGLRSLAFSPDDRLLAGGTFDGRIFVWDVATRKQLQGPLLIASRATPGLAVRALAFSIDDTVLVAGDFTSGAIVGAMAAWDVATGRLLRDSSAMNTQAKSMSASPDGRQLAVGSGGGTVDIWDLQRLQIVAQISAGNAVGEIDNLAFSADGELLAAANEYGTVGVWDLRRAQRLGQMLPGTDATIASVAFGTGRQRAILAVGTANGKIHLWDPVSRRPLGSPLVEPESILTSLAFGSGTGLLAAGTKDGVVDLWDTNQHQFLVRLTSGRHSLTTSVSFSPDGTSLVAGHADGTIRSWDVRSRRWRGDLLIASRGIVTSVTFSRDGRLLASAGGDGVIRLWDAQALREAPTHSPASSMATSLAFSPGGTMLASSSIDGSISLWDAASLKLVARMSQQGAVTSLAFSRDGEVLAAGGDNGAVTLWDPRSRQVLGRPLTAQSGAVTSIAFDPAGKTLASGSVDHTVVLWSVDLVTWKRDACRIAGRNLSRSEWNQLVGQDQPYHRTCSQYPVR
jgi:WD40 repeat protein